MSGSRYGQEARHEIGLGSISLVGAQWREPFVGGVREERRSSRERAEISRVQGELARVQARIGAQDHAPCERWRRARTSLAPEPTK